MIGMEGIPDNYYDLAVVDPPYGLGEFATSGQMNGKKWNDNIPSSEYFIEIVRVSKHQIIWGANYYSCSIKSVGRIIHNKLGINPNNRKMPWSLSWADIASQSFDRTIKIFEYCWQGNVKGNDYQVDWKGGHKIHPCEKPVALYEWIFKNYAKEGQKILDSHLGSGSSRIAAYNYKMDFAGYEIDKDYFEAAEKRFKDHVSQLKIFA